VSCRTGTTLDARWNLRIKYVEARSTAGRGHHGQQTRTTGGCDRDGRPSLPSLGSAQPSAGFSIGAD
jgi:hypothetical protein